MAGVGRGGPQDTEGFCRDTLADPALVAHLAENYVAWGGSVRYSDAYRVCCCPPQPPPAWPHPLTPRPDVLLNRGTLLLLAAAQISC